MESKEKLIWPGIVIILITFIFLFCIIFLTIPKDNIQMANIIIGFVSGVASCICNHYWGSAYNSTKPIDLNKKELTQSASSDYNSDSDESLNVGIKDDADNN